MDRGPILAILLIILSVGTLGTLVLTNVLRLPLPNALTGFQAAAYDPKNTQFTYTKAYNCNNQQGSGWFGYGEPNGPGTYTCTQSTTSSPTAQIPLSQTFSLTTATIGSDSNDMAYAQIAGANCIINNIGSNSCAHSSVYMPNYGISGTMQYPYNAIDNNFQNLYGETPPAQFPFFVGNDTQSNYYIWEYGFAIRLQVVGDVPSVTEYCLPPLGASRCQWAEQTSLAQALGFVNANDGISGKVGVDLTVPNSLITGPSDRVVILGAWTAAGGCKQISNIQYGGVISVQQCSSHTIIPATNLPYTPFNYQTVSSYTTNQAANIISTAGTSQTALNLQITVNNMQVKYTAACQGSGGCSATTTGDPIVQADMTPANLQLDVPIIFEVLQASPNKLSAGNGTCGGVVVGCPNPTSNFGAVSVHVTDSFWPIPISGVAVSIIPGTAGGCAVSNISKTTDNNGNAYFSGLGAGNYLVCAGTASGSSGSITILFLSFGVTYSQNTGQATVVVGQTSQVNIGVSSNVGITFTLAAIAIIVVVIILIAVVSVFFGPGAIVNGMREFVDAIKDWRAGK